MRADWWAAVRRPGLVQVIALAGVPSLDSQIVQILVDITSSLDLAASHRLVRRGHPAAPTMTTPR